MLHSWLVHPFAGLPACVCKGRKGGRPAAPLDEEVRQRWCTASNGGPAPVSGTGDQRQAYFNLDCGCKTKIQVKSAQRDPKRAFRCRLHGDGGRQLSAPQALAAWMLRRVPAAGPVSLEQYRVLPLAQKPVDLVLEAWNLMIEVDGQQHASSSSGFGAAPGEQCERDRAFEQRVLSSGGRLLRLHWADVASWVSTVLYALRRIQQSPHEGFVWYSPSYPPARRVKQP